MPNKYHCLTPPHPELLERIKAGSGPDDPNPPGIPTVTTWAPAMDASIPNPNSEARLPRAGFSALRQGRLLAVRSGKLLFLTSHSLIRSDGFFAVFSSCSLTPLVNLSPTLPTLVLKSTTSSSPPATSPLVALPSIIPKSAEANLLLSTTFSAPYACLNL